MSLEDFARHTTTPTHIHGKSWLRRIRWPGLCAAGRDWQQLPTTHPILLPPLLHAPARLSRASSSTGFQGFSQKSSNHATGMYLHNICSIILCPTAAYILLSFQFSLTLHMPCFLPVFQHRTSSFRTFWAGRHKISSGSFIMSILK